MKQYNILDYGAIADGVTNNAAAIQQAIDEASAEGGRVVIPQGCWHRHACRFCIALLIAHRNP